jgi:hypothetical protein
MMWIPLFFALETSLLDVCIQHALHYAPRFREAQRSDDPPTVDAGYGTLVRGVCRVTVYGRVVLVVRCERNRCTWTRTR